MPPPPLASDRQRPPPKRAPLTHRAMKGVKTGPSGPWFVEAAVEGWARGWGREADKEAVTPYPPPEGAATAWAATNEDAEAERALPDVRAYDPAVLRGNALASVVCALAAIGVVPIVIKSPRLPFRSTLPLCAVTYSLFAVSAVLLLCSHLPVVLAQKVDLDVRLVATELVVHLVPVLYVPVLWAQSRNICLRTLTHLKIKRMIQALAVEVVRRDVCLRVLYGAATLMLTVLSVLSVVFAYAVMPELHLKPVHLPALMYAVTVHTLLWWNVVVQLIQLLRLVRAVHDRFHQLVVSGKSTAASVRAYRRLWIELRELMGYDDDATHAVYVANMLYLLSQCTMTAFETVSFYTLANFWACVGHGLFCTAYLLEICILCDCAHRAVSVMKNPFIATLDMLSIGDLDSETYNEVSCFYNSVISKPPNYTIRGYASLDRPTLAAIFITIASYLIFLTQYRSEESTL